MPELNWGLIAFGCIGGILPDVIRFIKNRYDKRIPAYIKSPKYWASLLFQIILGGGAAWLLGASSFKDALFFGFGAPELISRLAGEAIAPPPNQKGAAEFNIFAWWSR